MHSQVIVGGLVNGPRIVILHRYNGDFGFTLRHFIVYPPESLTDNTVNPLTIAGVLNFVQPMDTVFVKKVHQNSPAHLAGLQEGDRLLAVNGVPVTSIPYSQVVATIQQTPKTLTLQVVPKNYDILQTFFRETAHNPETNQRPQPQQPYAPKPTGMAAGAYPKPKRAPPPPPPRRSLTVEGVQEKQESLYSTLQEIVADNVAATQPDPKGTVPLHVDLPKILNHSSSTSTGVPMVPHRMPLQLQKPLVPMVAPKPVPVPYEQHHYMNLHHQEQQVQKQQQFLQKTVPHGKEGTGEPNPVAGDGGYVPLGEGDNAIMSRLRKSLEQKEEFLRRPPVAAPGGALAGGPIVPAQPVNNGLPVGHDVQQREFYARPNRLQKSVWPPNALSASAAPGESAAIVPTTVGGLASPPAAISNATSSSPSQSGTVAKPMVSSSNMLREHASQLSAIREHFFTSGIGGSLQLPPKSAPPSLAIAPAAITTTAGPSSPTGGATVPLSPHSMHAVSEKAKLFESGRPLSPEGIDRMDLYKSELSRINTKQVVPNVAVRRKEFELKAESTGWRKSIEDKPRSVSSDSESRRTPVRLRSLSVESNATRDSRHSLASTLMLTNEPFELNDKDKENQQHTSPPVPMLRQKPIRDDSYRNAVRNSTGKVTLRNASTAGILVARNSVTGSSSSSVTVIARGRFVWCVGCVGRCVGQFGANRFGASDTTGPHVRRRPPASASTVGGGYGADADEDAAPQPDDCCVLRHFLAGDGDGGVDGAVGGDVEMFQRPPLTSPSLAPLSPLTVASTVTSTSSVPLTNLVALDHPGAGAMATSPPAPPSTPTATTTASAFRQGTAPIRPTTLNLCTDGSVPPVIMRQKQPHHPLLLEDDERKMRRISYLRATAHDNLFQMLESDADSSPMSLPPADTPDTDAAEPPAIESPGLPTTVTHGPAEDSTGPSGKMQPQQLKSAYRPWRRPRLTTDIQPLRRLFDPEPSDSTALSPILETEPSGPSAEPGAKKRSHPRPTPRPPQDLRHDDYEDVDEDDEDDEEEDPQRVGTSSSRTRPAPPAAAKARSASLVTTTPLGAGGGRLLGAAAGSLGNLHVITTTTAGGVVTRNYFFAQRFAPNPVLPQKKKKNQNEPVPSCICAVVFLDVLGGCVGWCICLPLFFFLPRLFSHTSTVFFVLFFLLYTLWILLLPEFNDSLLVLFSIFHASFSFEKKGLELCDFPPFLTISLACFCVSLPLRALAAGQQTLLIRPCAIRITLSSAHLRELFFLRSLLLSSLATTPTQKQMPVEMCLWLYKVIFRLVIRSVSAAAQASLCP
uniref:PDZ domain-containing protein n=1 Tax=Anopheles maculatus TaxID=74869 RepID=A0A182SQD6_9DIPT